MQKIRANEAYERTFSQEAVSHKQRNDLLSTFPTHRPTEMTQVGMVNVHGASKLFSSCFESPAERQDGDNIYIEQGQ